MRSGAAGSTRIASSPAIRISCRRRRANSLPSMPVSAFMSVQLLAVARAKRAVAVQQQHGYAHELLDLGQRVLVVLVAVFLWGRRSQPRQVRQRLAALRRQWRFAAGCQAEAAQEATAPVEQRAAALQQRSLAARQQQLEAELAVRQRPGAGLAELLQHAAAGDRRQ